MRNMTERVRQLEDLSHHDTQRQEVIPTVVAVAEQENNLARDVQTLSQFSEMEPERQASAEGVVEEHPSPAVIAGSSLSALDFGRLSFVEAEAESSASASMVQLANSRYPSLQVSFEEPCPVMVFKNISAEFCCLTL